MRVNRIMTPKVKTIRSDATLQELAEFFIEEGVSGAPVEDSGSVIGVVSSTDLVDFGIERGNVPLYHPLPAAEPVPSEALAQMVETPDRFFTELGGRPTGGSEAGDREWNPLEQHTVDEIVTRELLSVPPDAPIAQAARAMVDADVHRVLVMEGDEVIGLVTTMDVVRAVAGEGAS